jgi:hypothetical protein
MNPFESTSQSRQVSGTSDASKTQLVLIGTYHRLAAKMTRIQRQVESSSFKGLAL